MKRIFRLPGGGKTTELIRMSSSSGIPILCLDRSQKENIINMAKELNLPIHTPIIFNRFSTENRNLPFKSYLIDNADMILTRIINDFFLAEVEAISMDIAEGNHFIDGENFELLFNDYSRVITYGKEVVKDYPKKIVKETVQLFSNDNPERIEDLIIDLYKLLNDGYKTFQLDVKRNRFDLDEATPVMYFDK